MPPKAPVITTVATTLGLKNTSMADIDLQLITRG